MLHNIAIRTLIRAGREMEMSRDAYLAHQPRLSGWCRGRATAMVLEAVDILEGLEEQDIRRITRLKAELATRDEMLTTLETAIYGIGAKAHTNPATAKGLRIARKALRETFLGFTSR